MSSEDEKLVTVTLTKKDWQAVSRAARDSVRVSTQSCPWMDEGQVYQVRGILSAASRGWEQRDWPSRVVDGRYEEIKP